MDTKLALDDPNWWRRRSDWADTGRSAPPDSRTVRQGPVAFRVRLQGGAEKAIQQLAYSLFCLQGYPPKCRLSIPRRMALDGTYSAS